MPNGTTHFISVSCKKPALAFQAMVTGGHSLAPPLKLRRHADGDARGRCQDGWLYGTF